jgi:dTDP-4-dehydrorhamnose 3,5-epimerase
VIFHATEIPGVVVVDIERREDERGFFARTFCREEFAAQGMVTEFVQCSISYNRRRGTLRGMHFQAEPYGEAKLVRCSRGAIFDVALDLRPQSPAFKRWVGVELNDENGRMLYLPKGCAHGFQTLVDDSEVLYHISEFYHPEASAGVRWDDPAFGIKWPLDAAASLSVSDRLRPNWTSEERA